MAFLVGFEWNNGPSYSSVNIALNKVGQPYQTNILYSFDNVEWETYNIGNEIPIRLSRNVWFKCDDSYKHFSKNIQNRYQFSTKGNGMVHVACIFDKHNTDPSYFYDYCYNSLFEGCQNIRQVLFYHPNNVDTAPFCFANMFKDCTGLRALGSNLLPAKSVARWAYSGMFNSCTALRNPPALPASSLSEHCYDSMFYNCKSILAGPVLSATNLAPFCYNSMFNMCSNIAKAPLLPATTLVEGCYKNMFMDCKKLNSISANFSQWDESCTGNWVKGVGFDGQFNTNNLDILYGYSKIPYNWEVTGNRVPLTFRAKSITGAIALYRNNGNDTNFRYRINNGNWIDYTVYMEGTMEESIIPVKKGDIVSFEGLDKWFNVEYGIDYFSMTGFFESFGNVNSLINYENELYDWCFRNTFQGCTGLVTAPTLPDTELAPYCYYQMFQGCTSLTNAPPVLPATTLTDRCYYQMFSGCTNLTAAPDLPATELAPLCYANMFGYCSSLTSAPYLPATELTSSCYESMFWNCTHLSSIEVAFTDWHENLSATCGWIVNVASQGTFTKPSALSTIFGRNNIPDEWIVVDKD